MALTDLDSLLPQASGAPPLGHFAEGSRRNRDVSLLDRTVQVVVVIVGIFCSLTLQLPQHCPSSMVPFLLSFPQGKYHCNKHEGFFSTPLSEKS